MKNEKKIRSKFRHYGWSLAMALLFVPMMSFGMSLTVGSADNTKGTTTPAGTTSQNPLLLQAHPLTGYEFDYWDVTPADGSISPANVHNATAAFNAKDANGTYIAIAYFKDKKPVLIANHTGNGSITINNTPNSTGGTYDYGELVNLKAVPDPDSTFYSWSGDISGTDISTNIVMTNDMTVSANFLLRPQVDLYISSVNSDNEIVGNPTPDVGHHLYNYNQSISASVQSDYIFHGNTKRAYILGFVGTGSAPTNGAGRNSTGSFSITNDTTVTFNWRTDYRVTVHVVSSNGLSFVSRDSGEPVIGDDDSYWNTLGSTVVLTAHAQGGETFQGWSGTGVPAGQAGNLQISVLVDSAKNITASFGSEPLDADNDGLPDNWEAKYGLDLADPNGVNGAMGDPDNDGLVNIQEYRISYELITNTLVGIEASPINADSDGDGMDDGYEFNYILNPNENIASNGIAVGGSQQNALAVVDPDGVNGQDGNPDQDFLWSTNSGYETKIGLVNYQEYVGPDGEVPGDWSTTVTVPGITLPVKRLQDNLDDTLDQSSSASKDSEISGGKVTGDGFDDGFEYTWDKWQKQHAGEVSRSYVDESGVTNIIYIPAWTNPATRYFNPAVLAADQQHADTDLIYNPTNSMVGDWFTDEMEYGAWSNSVNPILRRDFPERRRCTNPFLWDTDGDRMPDGWELAFGYDPWEKVTFGHTYSDDMDNPDFDWYADDGSNKHYNVYLAHGFDPRTGYWYTDYDPDSDKKVNTEQFTNYKELVGPRGYAAVIPNDPDDKATHPFTYDTDGDGIWDGWEWYVNLNAKDEDDGIMDIDNKKSFDVPASPPNDGLSNFEEFNSLATSSTNHNSITNLVGWYNKTKPTDPWDWDTDGDQLSDSEEKNEFNTGADGFEGGGLTPTDADTDGDHLPDAWEAVYAGVYDPDHAVTNIIYDISDDLIKVTVTNVSHWIGGMGGNSSDAWGDADGDGLLNYQEYMIGAVPMWQFQNAKGQALWVDFETSNDPYDWFDETLSNGGEWFTGPGGRRPHVGDPHYKIGPSGMKIPWNFITAAVHRNGLWFSTADPTKVDTDFDDMDDYWEVFHGLDPLYGGYDIVRSKVFGVYMSYSYRKQDNQPIPGVPDLRLYPWFSGLPWTDVDQDELPNIYESAQPNGTVPYYHTDPSPAWITDTSSPDSWVNSQYTLGRMYSGIPGANYWYWDPLVLAGFSPPSYVYSFETREGFDSDNDNIADHAELMDNDQSSPGVTDPLESQAPIKRRALYLNGDAAARTMGPVAHRDPSDLRTFTLEVWVCPENPASGSDQIVLERSGIMPDGNQQSEGSGSVRRRNFVLGIDKDGRPYVGYDGAGSSSLFFDIKAPTENALQPGQWAHLAATYGGYFQNDGQWVGTLSLFINGEMVASTPSSIVPQNDWLGSDGTGLSIGFVVPMALTVGAGDYNPDGWVDGSTILTGPRAGDHHSQPVLYNYFTGWIDEVHVWDGARTDGDIRNSMMHRYTRKEVAALTTNAPNPSMRYIYTFDDLPDPDHSPISPDGFGLLNGRPTGYLSIPWWASAENKSDVYTDYMYVPWIDNLAGHGAGVPPLDTIATVNTNDGALHYPNTSNPYSINYFTATRVCKEHHPHVNDPVTAYRGSYNFYPDLLPLDAAVADEDVEMWDGGGLGTDLYDTDGDGMDDEWETKYGFDPHDSGGTSSPFADPDQDGLVNLYEYFAWRNNGIALNPGLFSTYTNGISDYFIKEAQSGLTFGELYDDTDVLPDIWEEKYDGLYRHYYNRNEDPDGDGWDNQSEYIAGTDPTSADYDDIPKNTISGKLLYNGPIDPPVDWYFHVLAYASPAMDSEPVPAVVYEGEGGVVYTFDHRALPSSKVYLFAYKSFAPGDSWKEFKPGNAYGTVGPIVIAFSDAENVDIPLFTETERPWYPVFSWTTPEDLSSVFVQVSEANGTLVLSRWITNDRNWHESAKGGWGVGSTGTVNWVHSSENFFHAEDYHDAEAAPGYNLQFGLPPQNYKWKVMAGSSPYDVEITNGMFAVGNWELPSSEVVFPKNEAIIVNQTYPFVWSAPLHVKVPSYEIEYGPLDASWITNKLIETPFQDKNGNYTVRMPIGVDSRYLFGSGVLTNGTYFWRVRAVNNGQYGAWSSQEHFVLNIESVTNNNAPITPTIKGNVMYYGRSSTDNITINAYRGLGVPELVDGRVVVTNSSSFTITGLNNSKYYLMAFIDLNKNHLPDEWEPQGIYRDSSLGGKYEYRADKYGVGVVDLQSNDLVTGVSILIRDRDTNNDNVPDGWDWEGRPASLQGDGFVALASDADGDGLSITEEYGIDSNPYSADSDNDGLSDAIEFALGTALNKDDSDGDGIVDLMEIAAGSSPSDNSDSNVVWITSMTIGASGLPEINWNVYSNNMSVDVQYILESSSNLIDWQEVGSLTTDGDANQQVGMSDTTVDDAKNKFYRLRLKVK